MPGFKIRRDPEKAAQRRQKRTDEIIDFNTQTLIDIAETALKEAEDSAPKTIPEIMSRYNFEPGVLSEGSSSTTGTRLPPRLLKRESRTAEPTPTIYGNIFPGSKRVNGMEPDFPPSKSSMSLSNFEDPYVSIAKLNLAFAKIPSRLHIKLDDNEVKEKIKKNLFYYTKTSHGAKTKLSIRIKYINKHLQYLYKRKKFILAVDYTNMYMKFKKDPKFGSFGRYTDKMCLMYFNYLLRKIVDDLERTTGKAVSIIMCGQNHFASQDFYEALDYFFDNSHPDNKGLRPISPTSENILILLGHTGSSEDDTYMALIGVEMFTNPSYEELSTSLGFLSDDNMTEYLIYNQVLDSDITAVGSSGLKDSLRSRNVSMINIQKYIDENPPDFDKLRRMADTHYSGHVSSVQPRPSVPVFLTQQPGPWGSVSSAQQPGPWGSVSSAQQPGHWGSVSSAQQPGHLGPGSSAQQPGQSGHVYYREDGHRDERRGYDGRGYDGRGYDGRRYRDYRFEKSRVYSPPYSSNYPSRGGGTIKYKKSLATKRSRKVYKKKYSQKVTSVHKKYKKHKTIKRKKRL